MQTDRTRTERAPQSDLDAEKLVIGALMADPNGVDLLGGMLTGEDFYSPRHADVFNAILQMHSAGLPTEPTAVAGYLADQADLGRLGGAPFLLECYQAAPPSVQLTYYAQRIADLADGRQVEANAIQVAQAVTTPGRDLADVAALAERLTAKVTDRRGNATMVPLGSLMNPALDRIEARKNRKAGIATGFHDLDKLIGGLRKKQLVTIAGTTSMGKSVTLIDIARNVAIKQGLTVAFFTLEMSNDEVFDRILAAQASVLHHHIRDGEMTEDDWVKATAQIGPMCNAPLFLSDQSPMNVPKIRAAAEAVRRTHGQLDLIIVDHMHLVKPSSSRIVEERAILEDVSNALKTELAMPMDVPVLAAAQLKRSDKVKADVPPELTDLKGSSSIEQMSNVVVIVHRPEFYDAESHRAGEADFVVAKNRDGARTTVTVASQLHFSRFADMAIV